MAQKSLRERIVDGGLDNVRDLSNLLSLALLDDNLDDVRLCYEKSMEKLRNREIEYREIYRQSLKRLARDDFDCYCIFLELDRPAERRFYLPRRRVLKTLVNDLQDLEEGKIEFLGVSLPPRVGKSTLCIFFMTWVMGRRPDVANLMSGHSDKLTDGFFREILSIINDSSTYNWHEVFDSQIVNTSTKNETIDLDKTKRFPTMTCRSISGTLTGAVEVGNGGILYCDDLVEDLEESLNPTRLQNKYDAYLNQLKDRKKEDAKELMVGTRWNVFDPMGRVRMQYEDNPKYRFRVIPALDENDESNFDYDYNMGFSTEYFRDMRESIDDATWWAKYMGQPYVREGIVFSKDDLNYYNGELPPGEPDQIIAACDVAWGGGDSLSMPIAFIYGEEVYIHDWIFDKGDKSQTKPMVRDAFIRHGIQRCCFEANNGGDEYADSIDAMLREDNYHANITTKRATGEKSKLGRILQYSPDIKKYYFVDEKHRSLPYRKAMDELTLFTQAGKNLHDDAPDSLALLADYLYSGYMKPVRVLPRFM